MLAYHGLTGHYHAILSMN